jgi:hypothetical protein
MSGFAKDGTGYRWRVKQADPARKCRRVHANRELIPGVQVKQVDPYSIGFLHIP